MRKTTVIRVDASLEIGSGHVMRCLTLAKKLTDQNYEVIFIMSVQEGQLEKFVKNKGYQVRMIAAPEKNCRKTESLTHSQWLKHSQEEDAEIVLNVLKSFPRIDLLVVDHYAIDHDWERIIKPNVQQLMVIDDLADREHECDILLDQNFYANMKDRYQGLVNTDCLLKLGPSYALLRPEFQNHLYNEPSSREKVKHLLIFFGGSDPTNETLKAIKAIKQLKCKDITADVIVGAMNPNKIEIEKAVADDSRLTYHYQISYMADLMEQADLAIGAGGSTTWERCAMGLPSITIGVAKNQIEILQNVASTGAIVYLGESTHVSVKMIIEAIQRIDKNSLLPSMALQAKKLMQKD